MNNIDLRQDTQSRMIIKISATMADIKIKTVAEKRFLPLGINVMEGVLQERNTELLLSSILAI